MIDSYVDTLADTVPVLQFIDLLKKGDVVEYIKKAGKAAQQAKRDL